MAGKGFDYESAYKDWKWEIPEYLNMGVDCVDSHVSAGRGEKVALLWENEEGKTAKFTYSQMKGLSDKFGNVLKDLGFKKCDRYIIRLSNVPEFQVTFLGGLKIGAVPIPISTMFTHKEISYRLNDSDANAVITSKRYLPDVEEAAKTSPKLKHIILIDENAGKYPSYNEMMKKASDKLVPEKTRSDDMAFFCYTSGTTGNPKGAVHLHRWAIANDPSFIFWQGYREGDIVGHTGSLNWIYPLGNGFLYAWRCGATVFLYDGRFDSEKWFQLLEKYSITNLGTVPTALRMMLSMPDAEKKYKLKKLRRIISAGEPLNPEVISAWKKRFGQEINEGIGMTEIMVYLSNLDCMPLKPGSCGKPQPGHVCAIVNEKGEVLGPNQPGTLAVRRDDPGLFREYWNKPDKTDECFVGDWFLSGDTLFVDDDGYYWFQGRGDDLIKASGYRISPFEVESALIEHEAVLEAAAVASPDELRGAVVKGFIVLRDGYEPSDELAKDIQKYVKENFAPYKYPREIEFVSNLPKTQSGKIKRKELREKEWADIKR